MKTFTNLETLPQQLKGGVAALGNFDGLHIGHQAVLTEAGKLAKDSGKSLGVVITEPHPVRFFKPDLPPFRLTPRASRLTLLAEFGVDWAYILPFDQSIASLSTETFVKDILIDRIGVGACVTGPDYHFGKARGGNPAVLQRLGTELGFQSHVIDLIEPEGGRLSSVEADKALSSSAIRQLISQGDMQAAASLLGYWWRVETTVIKGDQRGRTIGFPTANLALGDSIRPREGVYTIRINVDGTWYGGVANFGKRPTFDKKDQLLEAHLFDFSGDLYGKEIAVEFVDFIRPEQKFDGLDSLKAQIAADSETARNHLAEDKNDRSKHLLRPLKSRL